MLDSVHHYLLICNFRPIETHNINYWLYGTVTGFTGVALVVIMSVMYVFALPTFVRGAYRAFKVTHYLGFLFYALTIAHSIPALLAVSCFCCLKLIIEIPNIKSLLLF